MMPPIIGRHDEIRKQVIDGIVAELERRGYTVDRAGTDTMIVRIDGRHVNLWVMQEAGKKKRGKDRDPDRLLVRIGHKNNVRNIADADPAAVKSLTDGVVEWMEAVPLDPDYDQKVIDAKK